MIVVVCYRCHFHRRRHGLAILRAILAVDVALKTPPFLFVIDCCLIWSIKG
jgi:hypothetical protein